MPYEAGIAYGVKLSDLEGFDPNVDYKRLLGGSNSCSVINVFVDGLSAVLLVASNSHKELELGEVAVLPVSFLPIDAKWFGCLYWGLGKLGFQKTSTASWLLYFS